MATDPNRQLLADSITIDKAQPTYGLNSSQFAKVYHGQVIEGYTLSVEGGEVTEVTPPADP